MAVIRKKRLDRVIWLDRGWQPVYIGFCPSEAAWKHAMKRMGLPHEPYPESAGKVTIFVLDGKRTCIMTLRDRVEETNNRVEIAGLLAHEATHVKQQICDHIGEATPSDEFEAYSVQAIFQGFYQAWLDTRAPDDMAAPSEKSEIKA